MSLINQMLSDLEARKGGTLSHVDSALDGLQPAASLRAVVGERPRLVLSGVLFLGALAAAWTTREPLLAYLQAVPPTTIARGVAVPTPAPVPVPVTVDPAPATSIVVLEAPPAEALTPETFNVILPTSDVIAPLNPDVPEPQSVQEAAPASAPVQLDVIDPAPAPDLPPQRVVSAVREMPLVSEPHIDETKLGEPAVEYPGSFRRADTAAPPITPEARRLAEIEAFLANGDRDLALAKLRGLVLTDPTQEAARERLALELITDGRVTEAEALLRTGLRLAPGSTRLAQPLGHLLLAQSKPEAALAVLRPATPPLAGHTDFHALLAAAEQRTGAHGLAITRYRGLLKEQPLNGSWLVALAISLLAVDEREDAAATFARALDDRALPEPLRVYASREVVSLEAGPR